MKSLAKVINQSTMGQRASTGDCSRFSIAGKVLADGLVRPSARHGLLDGRQRRFSVRRQDESPVARRIHPARDSVDYGGVSGLVALHQ